MTKRKTTVYVEEDLLRRARVYAARAGKRDSEVVEEGLRSLLGIDILDAIWARSELTEEEAVRLASEALEEVRAGRTRPQPALDTRDMEILTLAAFDADPVPVAERLGVDVDEARLLLERVLRKLAPQRPGAREGSSNRTRASR
jgi:hypothetical protein